jgi:hypothetical protein
MSVAERTSFQTARAGWRPRKTSTKRLVEDIVTSIKLHAEVGIIRTAQHYTNDAVIIERVEALLAE